jgi:hypothetical protein
MSMAGGRITISRLLMLGALVSVGLWLCPDGVWAGESTGHDSTLIGPRTGAVGAAYPADDPPASRASPCPSSAEAL